jgi:hypothetical protein
MSKITRAIQKIFGGSLAPSSNIAQFGSLAAGSIAYSSDPAVIQALSQYLNGWSAAVQGSNSPALQDRNALDFLFSRQLAYLMQAGLAEWDSTTTYYTGSWCQVDGVPYLSLTDTNLGNNPTTETNDWRLVATALAPSMPGVAKAWIIFNGQGGGSTYDSYNATLTRNGTGDYTITFPTAIPFENYTFSLSNNQDDTVSQLCMATRFQYDTKTTSSFQFRVRDCVNGTAIDPSEVTCQIWSA